MEWTDVIKFGTHQDALWRSGLINCRDSSVIEGGYYLWDQERLFALKIGETEKGRKYGDRSGKRPKGKENSRGNRNGSLHPERAKKSEQSLWEADRWQNSPAHIKLTPHCNCSLHSRQSGMLSMYLRKSRKLPARVELGSEIFCLDLTFFSGRCPWTDFCWNLYARPLLSDIVAGWMLRREIHTCLNKIQLSWSATSLPNNMSVILQCASKRSGLSRVVCGISHTNRAPFLNL